MPPSPSPSDPPPGAPHDLPTSQPAWLRMLPWALASLLLSYLANLAQDMAPGNLVATTLYKAHLLALGGWVGYWLDRALYPYDRPHLYLQPDRDPQADPQDRQPNAEDDTLQICTGTFGHAMLRRAIVVAACVVSMGFSA